MAGKKRGLTGTMRAVATLLWTGCSLVVSGTLCVVFAPLNARISRAIALLWMQLVLFMAGVKIDMRGSEKLRSDKRYVFICNHQSHLDIPVLIVSLHRPLSFIAKKELFRIPFFGWGMYALGHVWIDRGNARKAHASIKQAVGRLQKDNFSLVLFPEGTRSADGTIGQFRQGSFSLVQQAGAEVVPIAIRHTSQLLPKYSLLVTAGTVRLIVGDPIVIDESMSKADISERLHAVIRSAVENDRD